MIKVYKTFEISDNLWQQIADGFNESFEGHHITVESLKNGFSIRNQWGYAYHAVAIDDNTGDVKGFNTYHPSLYKNGLKFLVSGSVFVKKKYRKDIFIFWDMLEVLRTECLKDGFVLGLGVPNHNALDYSIKFLGSTLVGFLPYYILPVHPSKVFSKPYLKPIDAIMRFFVKGYVFINRLISSIINSKEKEVKYSLDVDEKYLDVRFGSTDYRKYHEGSFKAYYRMVDESGINTAYLMDFRENNERTSKALAKAVTYILKADSPDAILFVGHLRLQQLLLFKVPKKFIPKPLPLTCGLFDYEKSENLLDFADINKWNFGLMNFDVR